MGSPIFSLIIFIFVFVLIRRTVTAARKENETIAQRQQQQAQALNRQIPVATPPQPQRVPAQPTAFDRKSVAPKPVAQRPAANRSISQRASVPVSTGSFTDRDLYSSGMSMGSKGAAKVGTSIKDDRSNDWLAKQMKEERAALIRMGYMFGFKTGTGTISAAAANREFHAMNCDSEGVDTAAGR